MKTIKIVIGLLVFLVFGGATTWYFYDNYQAVQSAKIISEKEAENKRLTKEIETVKAEYAKYLEQIKVDELEKDMLRGQIENNRGSINALRAMSLESNKKYAEKISNISSDTTAIYSRCLRMCESASKLGTEFSCVNNFCDQFSTGSARTTTTK